MAHICRVLQLCHNLNHATCSRSQGLLEAAYSSFREAVQLLSDPDVSFHAAPSTASSAMLNLSSALVSIGRPAFALEYVRSALEAPTLPIDFRFTLLAARFDAMVHADTGTTAGWGFIGESHAADISSGKAE